MIFTAFYDQNDIRELSLPNRLPQHYNIKYFPRQGQSPQTNINARLLTGQDIQIVVISSNNIEIELTELWLIYLRKTAGYVTLKIIESEAVILSLPMRAGP